MKLLEKFNDAFFKVKPYAYFNHVKVFNEYIESLNISEENIITFLQGIRSKNIIDSLEFYIDKNNVTSKDTAFRYISALKEYLYFIIDVEKINNSELKNELELATYKEESYRNQMNNFVAKHKLLKDREGFKIPSYEDIEELVNQCNILLESEDELIKAETKEISFNKIRSAIIVKLILLTGAPYRSIYSMNINDLDINNSLILINNFEVRLPKILKRNFERYLELSNNINPNREKLFINFNGDPMSNQTSIVYNFLNSIIGRGDLNGIIKFTIIKMLEIETSEMVIKQVTGLKDLVNDCHEIVYSSRKANRHFDSKIRALEIYDEL